MPRRRSPPQAVDGVNYWPSAMREGVFGALNPRSEAPDIDWQSERIDGVPALRTPHRARRRSCP